MTLIHYLAIFLLCPVLIITEEPWGKDVFLVSSAPIHPFFPQTSLVQSVATPLIHFHQKIISPADGPRSHYIPSSSQYTLDGMHKYGFFKGFLLGCDRLMRENSEEWIYRTTTDGDGKTIKYDPIR